TELGLLEHAMRRFCALKLTDTQRRVVAQLEARRASDDILSPIEVADRRDAVDDWLAARGLDGVDARPLAETGIVEADLEALAEAVPEALETVLTHISIGRNVRQLTDEIGTAAARIHALVDAVKGFTYVNQQTVPQPVAIGRGLSDTITVLGSKARAKSVEVELQVADDLPT